MKKIGGIIALLLLTTVFLTPHSTSASIRVQDPVLYIDGEQAEYIKTMQNKKTEKMIPLRTAINLLDYKLKWIKANKEWTLSYGKTSVRMKLNDTKIYVNGKSAKLNVPPMNVKDTIYIPLRFIVETGGGKLEYYKDSTINVIWVLSPTQNKLTTAVLRKDLAMVKATLKDWTELTIPLNVGGVVPYGYAVQSLEMTTFIIEVGFPIDYQEYAYDHVLFEGYRSTLLQEAAGYGKVDVVKYLIELGADPTLGNSIDPHFTALEIAKLHLGYGYPSGIYGDTRDREMLSDDFNTVIELLEDYMEHWTSSK